MRLMTWLGLVVHQWAMEAKRVRLSFSHLLDRSNAWPRAGGAMLVHRRRKALNVRAARCGVRTAKL